MFNNGTVLLYWSASKLFHSEGSLCAEFERNGAEVPDRESLLNKKFDTYNYWLSKDSCSKTKVII